jgi:hypothetical protein
MVKRSITSYGNLLRRVTLVGAAFGVIGCVPPDGDPGGATGADGVETVRSALTTVEFDDSVSPVHVQVKTCRTDVAQTQQTIDCTVDSGYALIGGGAYAVLPPGGGTGGFGGSVPLKQTQPLDGRTWRAASGHHSVASTHTLSAVAVGLRLDGVNAATLRGMITRLTIANPVPQSSPGVTIGNGSEVTMLSGGALATLTSGLGHYLTQTRPAGSMAWEAMSTSHTGGGLGTITGTSIRLMTTGIIERFGKLEAAQRTGSTTTVSSGENSVFGNVTPGWAIAGYGANATTTSGPGRMLSRIRDSGPRSVLVTSRDVAQSSGGSITPHWSEVRRVPNSHGLCTEGGKLAASMDPCVATICAPGVDPYCCNNFWDSICVGEVTSVCGKSCADHACSQPSFAPAFWNDGGTVQSNNNSYNYANNRRTDTSAEPGRASGEFCTSPSCMNVATLKAYAVADGLIAFSPPATCPFPQSVLALYVAPNVGYVWYRVGAGGWSYKPGTSAATNLDFSGNPIVHPDSANRGIYTTFGGYFCSCSSSVEGGGHAVIN